MLFRSLLCLYCVSTVSLLCLYCVCTVPLMVVSSRQSCVVGTSMTMLELRGRGLSWFSPAVVTATSPGQPSGISPAGGGVSCKVGGSERRGSSLLGSPGCVQPPCLQAHRQTDRQADRQVDREADRQVDRQADRQVDRQAGRQTGRHADRQTCRQADRQADRQIDR